MKVETISAPRTRRSPSADAIRRARQAYANDGGIDHEVVGAWLLTWGQPGSLPFAEWLVRQDG